MARLTNKQKFDILSHKIIPLGLHIVNGGKVTSEDYSAFDSYAYELRQFKPSLTLKEEDILAVQLFVSLVYQCIDDRMSALTKLLFDWTC